MGGREISSQDRFRFDRCAMMAGNGGGGASISTAAAVAGSTETRFIRPHRQRRSWGGCWGRFSCFRPQKGAKRIVPSTRTLDGTVTANRVHGTQQIGISNQTTTMVPSLLAPPSSPASFTNSAIPSTAQSPSCFLSLSANSPVEPSSTMFVTGPYANETQSVSPPVFSTFTTEPSTAPLTPPPELAHLTTPSSPDVPYARYLSSSLDLKNAGKESGLSFVSTGYLSPNDLRVTYPLDPESPASSLISPMSQTPRTGRSSPFPEGEVSTQWTAVSSAKNSPHSRYQSWNLFGVDTSKSSGDFMVSDAGFYPASSAQFHLDHAQQSYSSYPSCGGRLSVSREGNRHTKTCKQDAEEGEAYRASFGFSADEIITTPSYVEISDTTDISFSVPAFTNNESESCSDRQHVVTGEGQEMEKNASNLMNSERTCTTSRWADLKLPFLSRETCILNGNTHNDLTDEILLRKMRDLRVSRSFRAGISTSDAEIDYRRSRSSNHAHTPF